MLNRFLVNYIGINSSGLIMRLFLIFMIYSVIGWLVEVSSYIIEDHKFVNRGFMMGPYCPIHAFGALSAVAMLYWLRNKPILVFILGTLIAALLEYFTSYMLEKIFHARWWDYSNAKYNLNGRIKLNYLILFGIGIEIIIYIINPIILKIVNSIPLPVLTIISTIIFIIVSIDCLFTLSVVSKLKLSSHKAKDNTEEISAKVRKKFKKMLKNM